MSRMSRKKLIFIGGVANSFEWYDYALFGHFISVLGVKFFPAQDEYATALQTFLVFAIGYLIRPVGGIIFGIIGDKFGRKVALSSAVICMALPTTLMGLLPTYDSIGIAATILMVLTRVLQGLSMGGALTGSISFMVEHTDESKRGLVSSISMASICIGMLLGSLSSFLTQTLLSEEDFLDFGWRIPFIMGIVVFFVGWYIRQYAHETPTFNKSQRLGRIEDNPLKVAIVKYWRKMLISILINATGSILFYMEAIYLAYYLQNNRGFSIIQTGYLINFCFVLMIFVTIFAGWLSDIVGRKKIFIANILTILVIFPYLIDIFAYGDFTSVILAQIIMAIIAAFYIGPEPALQAELYPAAIRNTALSVSYNLATSIFGGTAPYILELFVYKTGSITSSAHYVTITAGLSLIALCFYRRAHVLK